MFEGILERPVGPIMVVYKSLIKGAKENKELPFLIYVLGTFTTKNNTQLLEKQRPITIGKDKFNKIMEAQDLRLSYKVPDMISKEQGKEMEVNLHIKSIDDFSPDHIIEQIPKLQKLLNLREAIRSVKGPLVGILEFRKRIREMMKDEKIREQLLKELKNAGHQELKVAGYLE